jgi:hypothetical protein
MTLNLDCWMNGIFYSTPTNEANKRLRFKKLFPKCEKGHKQFQRQQEKRSWFKRC